MLTNCKCITEIFDREINMKKNRCRFTNEVQNHSLTPWGKRSRKRAILV